MEWIRRAGRITYLWPGLDGLWHEGRVKELAMAVGFAALLNIMVGISFLMPGPLPGATLHGATSSGSVGSWTGTLGLAATLWSAGWFLVGLMWVVGIWLAARRSADRGTRQGRKNREDLFIQAQAEYLRGHWIETQVLLERQIRLDPGDVESHLLLSSVYRRTGRRDLSRRQLLRTQGFQGSQKWRSEIDRELKRLAARPAADT